MTPEGRVKHEIKQGLAKMSNVYAFWPVQVGYGARTVDLLVCCKGKFFAFEVKREEGGKVTAAQHRTIEEVIDAGGAACVVRSWDEVLQELIAHVF